MEESKSQTISDELIEFFSQQKDVIARMCNASEIIIGKNIPIPATHASRIVMGKYRPKSGVLFLDSESMGMLKADIKKDK